MSLFALGHTLIQGTFVVKTLRSFLKCSLIQQIDVWGRNFYANAPKVSLTQVSAPTEEETLDDETLDDETLDDETLDDVVAVPF